MEKQQLLLKTQRMAENKHSKSSLKKIYNAFEKEFGRLLSPTEAHQITIWLEEYKINPELVFEALRRAGLRGVLNFRYIDKILLDWQKRKVETLKDLLAQEENHNGWDKQRGKGKLKANQRKGDNSSGEDDDEFSLLYLS